MSDREEGRVVRAIQAVCEAPSLAAFAGRLVAQLQELSRSRECFLWEVPEPGTSADREVMRANRIAYLDAWVELLFPDEAARAGEARFVDASGPDLLAELRAAVPPGSAQPQSVLVLPLRRGGETVAWAGFVDCPEGHSGTLAATLEPLLAVSASVLLAFRIRGGGKPESEPGPTALRRMQKADAIEALASGVAHDLNNVLYVVSGNAELGLKKGGEENPLAKYFTAIRAAARRGAGVTERLLTYRRLCAFAEPWCDFPAAMEESRQLLEAILPPSMEVVFEGIPGNAVLPLSASDLHQVLLALCSNAARASLEQGIVRIRVRSSEGAGEGGRSRLVEITVSDDGEGMAEPVREAAFSPGFTTRPTGKAGGLGLAVVQGIVTAAGGRVSLESAPGRGTDVRIELPGRAPDVSSDSD